MGHRPGQRCLERSEEVIEQGLEAAFEGAEQEGDKDPGKVRMRCREKAVGRVRWSAMNWGS